MARRRHQRDRRPGPQRLHQRQLRLLHRRASHGPAVRQRPPARVAAVSPQISRKVPGKYEIDATWQSDEIKTYHSNITIPATAVTPGRTYRVRCRMKDSTGRWSHWSSPVQFAAGEPLAAGILENLRITEVMYNPPALAGDGIDNNEFEFIEIKNIGDETLDLSSVSFDKGVTFAFAGSNVTTLGAGKFALVVKNKQAFLSRYGSALAGSDRGRVRRASWPTTVRRSRWSISGTGRLRSSSTATAAAGRRPPTAAGTRSSRWMRPCSQSRKAP